MLQICCRFSCTSYNVIRSITSCHLMLIYFYEQCPLQYLIIEIAIMWLQPTHSIGCQLIVHYYFTVDIIISKRAKLQL